MQIELTPEEEAQLDITKALPEAEMGLIVYAQPRSQVICPSCLSDSISGDLFNFYTESCMTPIPINRKTITYCRVLKAASVGYATRVNNQLNLNINFAFDVENPTTLLNTNINDLIPGINYSVKVLSGWKFQKQHNSGPIEFSQLSVARVNRPYPVINRICALNPSFASSIVSQPSLIPGSLELKPLCELFSQAASTVLTPTSWSHDSNGWMNQATWTKTQEIGGYTMQVSLVSTRTSRSEATAVFSATLMGPNFVGSPPTQTIYSISATAPSNPAVLEVVSGMTVTSVGGWLTGYIDNNSTVAII